MNMWVRLLSVTSLLLAPLAAGAAEPSAPEVDYVLRAGTTYSDNLFRAPPGLENSVGAFAFGAEMRGGRETGRLLYAVALDVMRYEYFDEYSGETFGRALLEGSYDFVPETFRWNARAGFDQYADDPTRPLAPGNVNSELMFGTGPTFRARFRNAFEGQLDVDYEIVQYSGSDLDNQTLGGRALVGRRANPQSFLALGASYDDVAYDDELVSRAFDFRRQEAFTRYEHTGARSRIDAEVGYADVSGDFVDDNGPLFRGYLSRRLTPMLTASVGYIHEYPTSSGSSFETDPTGPGGGDVDNTIVVASPRVTDTLNFDLTLVRARTEAQLAYSSQNDESLIGLLGERSYDKWRFRVSRDFTPSARGTFYVAKASEEFTTFTQDYDDMIFGGELTILFGRSLGLDFRAEYRDRNAVASDEEYQEVAWGLFLRYSGGFGRSTTLSEQEQLAGVR